MIAFFHDYLALFWDWLWTIQVPGLNFSFGAICVVLVLFEVAFLILSHLFSSRLGGSIENDTKP